MLPALAELDQLAARIRNGVPPEEVPRAEAALEDASALVRDECGREFVDRYGNLDVPDAIVRVVLAVARRDYLNPDGARSDTQAAGPFSQTRTLSNEGASCYLTEAELEICQRYQLGNRGGLQVVSTTRADFPAGLDAIWVREDQGGYFPLQVPWEFRES